jgi:hypothetical protein
VADDRDRSMRPPEDDRGDEKDDGPPKRDLP